MIGLHIDCAVMNTLLRQNDPELHAHLNQLGLNMEIHCTKWLVIDMLLARSNEKQRASRVLLGVDAGEVLLAINDFFARETTKTTVDMDAFLHFFL
ncbi:hypothetical protein PsorP6_007557 [Peronosclerospora sorghi]|uniref:Uncharacterized protein n=1 Tax=Peronosclerospora sorghi TaxID=230839 RepID=A0ACC0W946_9STRA|nr:hypothetical protein PsorP6_007557 [Peronosclerospora sorghi]